MSIAIRRLRYITNNAPDNDFDEWYPEIPPAHRHMSDETKERLMKMKLYLYNM